MSWRRLHRWLAIILVVPLVVWSITGLLFHIKPGWDRAYDQLGVEQPGAGLKADALITLAPALAGEQIERIDAFTTATGGLARVTTKTGAELFDLTTGRRVSPLSAATARTLALDAIARSPHHGRYGEVVRVDVTEHAVALVLADGIVVQIGRDDARISQHGDDTARIDWLYRIHYLQWTGNQAIDRVLALVGLALIWAVLIPGLVLFVRRPRAG